MQSNNKKEISKLIFYPIVVDGVKISNGEDFQEKFDVIFSDNIKSKIKNQKYADLFAKYSGVMLGDGEVWFTGICLDKGCKNVDVKIISLNPTIIATKVVSPTPAATPVATAYSHFSSDAPLAKAGETVNNKNLKFTLEAFVKKYQNHSWRSEDNLDIEVSIVKGSRNVFTISGAQVPRGYSLIQITCYDPLYASVVKSLSSSNTRRQLDTRYWQGMPDTETESGKPRFLIEVKECGISAPGMRF